MGQMSPLRRRMIEDMTVRNLAPATQQSYLYAVARFSRHFARSPARLGLEHVRAYQVHLAAQKRSWSHINQASCALRFFYGVTLGRSEVLAGIVSAREPQKLPVVLSADEIVQFLEAVPGPAQPRSADHGLWRRPAGRGSQPAQAHRHRQRPQGHPDRAGQRRQGPLCHAVGTAAADPARVLAAGAASPVAVPRTRARSTGQRGDPAGGVPGRQPRGRTEQAGDRAHPAPQLRHPSAPTSKPAPTFASSKSCSAMPGWRPPPATPRSRPA